MSGPNETDKSPLDWDWEYQAPKESKTDDACYTEYDWECAVSIDELKKEDSNE